MRNIGRGRLTTASIFGAVVALAGCAPTQPARGVPWSGYNAEYLAETHHLQLPRGVRWPAKATGASVGPDGAKVNYEVGAGKGDADYYW